MGDREGIIIDGRFTNQPIETRSISTNYIVSKHYCPFCKIEMIRPRQEMLNRANLKDDNSGDFTIDGKGKIGIADSLLEFKLTEGDNRVKYLDYMCPQCKVVLLFGEIVNEL